MSKCYPDDEISNDINLNRSIKFQLNKNFGWNAVRWFEHLNENEKDYIRVLLRIWKG